MKETEESMTTSTRRAIRGRAGWLFGLALALSIIAMTADARAQAGKGKGKSATADSADDTDDADSGDKKDDAPKVKVERGKGGRKVYRITQGFVIEGRIQKPNAFYVLQRSQINYDWADLKQKFVPRITEAVRKSPF